MSANVDALAEAVAARVAELLADRPLPDALLDAAAAAALLSVPESWLLREARADRIPHVRLGRYVRFERSELLAWRKAQARGPAPLCKKGRAA
jgi:excisionase family DNA binding protein